jgi:hypothetical protein
MSPLALFLDDLQWLDTATLDLVEEEGTRGISPGLFRCCVPQMGGEIRR